MSKITNREILSFFLGAFAAFVVFVGSFNVWRVLAGQRESDSSYKEAAKHFVVPIPSGGHLAVSDIDGIAIIVVDPNKLSFRDGRNIVSKLRKY